MLKRILLSAVRHAGRICLTPLLVDTLKILILLFYQLFRWNARHPSGFLCKSLSFCSWHFCQPDPSSVFDFNPHGGFFEQTENIDRDPTDQKEPIVADRFAEAGKVTPFQKYREKSAESRDGQR